MTPEEMLKAWTKAQVELVSAMFDNATRYSNIFILAGYGSFFGLWNVTHDRLVGHRAPIVAALLMLLSVTSFVLFQIYSVYLNSSAIVRQTEAFIENPPASVDELLVRIEEHGFIAKMKAPALLRLWRPVFFFTVTTGLLAMAALGFSYVRTILA